LGEHKFWNTQAIVTTRNQAHKKGEIKHFNKNDIPKEPLKLPEGFEWGTFDIEDDDQVGELKTFLENHYVEDNVGNFRLKYSADKLRWGIQMPGYIKDLQFVVRSTKGKKPILASLIGIPKTFIV
jgi:glycylpeptide N-tetradecanoyltransferase